MTAAGSDRIEPFRIAIPDAALQDLRDRIRRTRWPERETVDDWSQGVPINYLRGLVDYWQDAYDWRAREAGSTRSRSFARASVGLGSTVSTFARAIHTPCRC